MKLAFSFPLVTLTACGYSSPFAVCQCSMHDKYGLLSTPISSVLCRMTIPVMFGMIAILMFNLVNTFFVSLLGTHALAAISFTFPVTFTINCVTMGIGVGLSTRIGHLIGQGNAHSAARLATHGLLLSITTIVIIALLGRLSIDPLFLALGADHTLLPLIHQYMDIWYLIIPLLVIPMTSSSIVRATGNTKTPAKMMMFSALLNSVLDPLFIFGCAPIPAFGIQGAALASAISWLCVCIGFTRLLIRSKLLSIPQLSLLLSDWSTILKLGTPAALSNAMVPITSAIFMRLLSTHGTTAVAAFGAAQRIESILMIVLMSLTSALSPFMAQNFGAQKPQRSFTSLFVSMRFALLFQSAIFIAMVPLSVPLSALFSQEPTVRSLLWHYLLIVPISYGFQGMVMMLIAGLNALQKPLYAFLWSSLRLFILTLPLAWLGSQYYGAEGLFAGIALGNVLAGMLSYFFALRLRKTLGKPVRL